MTVTETIAQQVQQAGIRPTALVRIDDDTLRVHVKRGRNVRNVDVRYDAGLDLYDVSVHRFQAPTYEVATETFEGVYADSMVEIVRGFGFWAES